MVAISKSRTAPLRSRGKAGWRPVSSASEAPLGRYGDSNGSKTIWSTGWPGLVRYTQRSTTFFSSRMLPGQSCDSSRRTAWLEKPGNTSRPSSLDMSMAKRSASSMMSSRRSRRGGKVMTSNASRSSRSLRNLPSAAKRGRSSLVAAIRRTSARRVLLPPTRSNSPYSMTRNSFSCTKGEVVASSSRNSVPPSARSKRPWWVLDAPVKAPASWPNNSLSSSASDMAAQFIFRAAWAERSDSRCRRSAINSLPVPRSPTMSAGFSSGAIREVASSTSRKAGDSPIGVSGLVIMARNLTKCWSYPPSLYRSNRIANGGIFSNSFKLKEKKRLPSIWHGI